MVRICENHVGKVKHLEPLGLGFGGQTGEVVEVTRNYVFLEPLGSRRASWTLPYFMLERLGVEPIEENGFIRISDYEADSLDLPSSGTYRVASLGRRHDWEHVTLVLPSTQLSVPRDIYEQVYGDKTSHRRRVNGDRGSNINPRLPYNQIR